MGYVTTASERGEITYSTDETFYHVLTIHGWIGEVKIGARGEITPCDHPVNKRLTAYTPHQPYAHLFSKLGAIKCAEELRGTAYRLTRTGKLQPMKARGVK